MKKNVPTVLQAGQITNLLHDGELHRAPTPVPLLPLAARGPSSPFAPPLIPLFLIIKAVIEDPRTGILPLVFRV